MQWTKHKLPRLGVVFLSLVFTGMVYLMAAEKTGDELRKEAKSNYDDGNFADAYSSLKKLVTSPATTGDQLLKDLELAANCLQRLTRQAEIDPLLKDVLDSHPDDWTAYVAAARVLRNIEHYGFIVAGEFSRGSQRGGGAYVDVSDRDRAQSLIWMETARQKMPADVPGPTKSEFFSVLASMLQYNGGNAWKLQQLTDLTTLPDYPEPEQRGRFFGFRGGYGASGPQGAPVDADGNPIYYSVPESFEAAKNDGERWRWCLQQVAEFDPSRLHETRKRFADFLHQQFGVQTLRQFGVFLPRADNGDESSTAAGIWSLPTLKENETIARLANGVKRFTLPDEFNYIKIYRELADLTGPSTDTSSKAALNTLATIFLNRQQYPRAVSCIEESLKRFPDHPDSRKSQLKQITGNWGAFEPVMSSAAGKGATVDFRFRNAKKVTFEAHALKVPELLADVQKYLETKPEKLDWQKIQIDNIGYQIVQENETKYLGEKVAEWSLDLAPRENHFDRRITVTTPLQKGGAYLVTAKIADGNTTRIILWLNDTAIVKKNIDNKVLYYVADAVTGAPINKIKVDFFGWRQESRQNPRSHRLLTSRFAEFTNSDGMIFLDGKVAAERYQWLATAKDDQGRFAYLGFSGIWYSKPEEQKFREVKTYIVTDRPVYRPDQKVQFKLWIREAQYDQKEGTRFANKKFKVKINDPQGTEVFSQEFTADEYGGLAGEYSLPKQAPLGAYTLYIDGNRIAHGSNQFRVEEYKKPEFEVTIEAPKGPVELGEKITATVNAKYYYGAPVTDARVQVKVERTTHDVKWYPADRWDWLYGNGYWWFSPDYRWFPGFARWGCFGPRPSWIHWSADPPELILDQEVTLNADGTASIEIDTSLAKALHGNQDHEYKITAEVTDASRRTIVGSGKVLAGREPFRIFAWTDRGYYNVGDTISARFQARTLDGKGIAKEGKLQLLKVDYKEGQPVESVVQEWDLATNEEGFAEQVINASQSGQYRLSYKLPRSQKGDEGTIEGGYLFLVRGDGFDGANFHFNDLELVLDKKNYAPGDKVKLLINTNRLGATVLLFVRPVNGVAPSIPQVLKLEGKSTVVELDVSLADMPNFFVEAITIAEGKLHDLVRDIAVPPAERILNIDVVPSAASYLPGQKAEVEIKVTDSEGKPVVGAVLMSVYDRAVEYISGGSNVEDIKEFFWKWRRSTHPQAESNLQRWFEALWRNNEELMSPLGAFGDSVADRDEQLDALYETQNQAFGRDQKRMSTRGRAGGMGGGMIGGLAMPAAAPMSRMMSDVAMEKSAAPGGGDEPVQPTIRTNFADTAYWNANLVTDASGKAKVTFDMPENLSSWKIRAWGMGAGTNVGEATRDVVTAKNLVVRLQAPRFFVQTDEVVLSAVVHNYLKTEKQVQVQLQLEGETLAFLEEKGEGGKGEEKILSTTVTIPAGGEHRVDWRVKAVQPGDATITMKALTDEESDAMQMTFPVLVHGILKTESFSGVIRPDAESQTIEFTIPDARQAEQSRLEVRYSPTLAGAMVDALPYLVDYPYGCTEQTLNRFVPTVITQRILQKMQLDLKVIQEKRTNLNAQQIGDPAERAKQWKRFDRNPVFDVDEVIAMAKTGVRDLTAMQNPDGGWGWFSGYQERSYPHTTAVVVHGLQIAAKNDVALVDGVLENGVVWLKRYQDEQIALLQEGERREKDPNRKEKYRTQCNPTDAFVFSVLVDAKVVNEEMQRFLYRDRTKIGLYAEALLGLALHEIGAVEQRDMVIKNIDQFIKVDDENQTAYLDLPNNGGSWWFWYGNTLEANAQYLKLLTRVNVKDPKAAGLVKYLINNRRHGTYWNSTRDTAYCIEALAEYLIASGEGKPNMAVEVWLDGELKQTVEITPEVLFTFNNGFILEGDALTAGKHKLELKRKSLSPSPLSPLYFNAYVTNFTMEEFITATGLEIKVERKYYRLEKDADATTAVSGDRGQVIDQKVTKYKRVPLKSLDEVVSGDLIEIELEIDSKNDYEYIIFEDMKAAGCEPVDVQSGYTAGGLGAYVEFRDEKVAFFLRQLARGKHSVSYRVRAEIPGKFSALPTQASGMYAPELKANSDEMKLQIADQPE